MSPPLLLFDLDDTLCDYASAREKRLDVAFRLAFELANIEYPRDYRTLIQHSVETHPHGSDHFAEMLAPYGVLDPEAVKQARQWYQTNRFEGLALFPDAIPTLSHLRASITHRVIGVITNGPAEVQRAKIELLNVEKLVDFVIISGEFGVAKPDPAIFREALRLGGERSPIDAVFVGDSPEFDIAGAHRAGIRSIWMNRTGQPWQQQAPPPHLEINQLSDLAPLLD